jgi:hypothetical protein
MTNQEHDTPNRPPNTEKEEGNRKSEWGEGTSEGAGESIRPMSDAIGNREPVPARGNPTPGTVEG